MELEIFINKLGELAELTNAAIRQVVINSDYSGVISTIQNLNEIVPVWIAFVDQTAIGNKQDIIQLVSDMMNSVEKKDNLLLVDVLENGLLELLNQYICVITEALDEDGEE